MEKQVVHTEYVMFVLFPIGVEPFNIQYPCGPNHFNRTLATFTEIKCGDTKTVNGKDYIQQTLRVSMEAKMATAFEAALFYARIINTFEEDIRVFGTNNFTDHTLSILNADAYACRHIYNARQHVLNFLMPTEWVVDSTLKPTHNGDKTTQR